jgi:hypothetical protein
MGVIVRVGNEANGAWQGPDGPAIPGHHPELFRIRIGTAFGTSGAMQIQISFHPRHSSDVHLATDLAGVHDHLSDRLGLSVHLTSTLLIWSDIG